MTSVHRLHCRYCYRILEMGTLVPFADLGPQPLADRFLSSPDDPDPAYPLRVSVCSQCKLVQHTDIVADELLFGEDYAFFTGASPSSIGYFARYAAEIKRRFPKNLGFVVEIASSDGTLLKHFDGKVLGVEPAVPPAEEAVKAGIPTLVQPFSLNTAFEIRRGHGHASLIMANNVVAHVDKLLDFLAGVTHLLDEDGVFVCEVQYLPHLLFTNAFDHLYHEHRSFFSFRTLRDILKTAGLEVFDVIEADTQGGSIRVYSRHVRNPGRFPDPELSVARLLDYEQQLGLSKLATYESFQPRVTYLKTKLLAMLRRLKTQGKTVYGFGASAKGSTLLNTCGITSELVPKIVDLTPYKIGKFTPGSHIPVVHPDSLKTPPDYYLLLVWNYLSGVMEREEGFRKGGGKFIVPIPLPVVI